MTDDPSGKDKKNMPSDTLTRVLLVILSVSLSIVVAVTAWQLTQIVELNSRVVAIEASRWSAQDQAAFLRDLNSRQNDFAQDMNTRFDLLETSILDELKSIDDRIDALPPLDTRERLTKIEERLTQLEIEIRRLK